MSGRAPARPAHHPLEWSTAMIRNRLIRVAIAGAVAIGGLSACTEVPAHLVKSKVHTIKYKVVHGTPAAKLKIGFGYQNNRGDEVRKSATLTNKKTYVRTITTSKTTVQYVEIRANSARASDRISCQIFFDGVLLVTKHGRGEVIC
jgi:sporulation-control protein spo0M